MRESKPISTLTCCVCGDSTCGRQWWNRDTGYGICAPCIAYVRTRGYTDEQIHDYYGFDGVHWNVESEVAR
jgi:hypothetical protein